MVDEEKVKVKDKASFALVEVPTQMGIAIKNISSGEVMSEAQALVLILNEIQLIKKAVA